MDLTAIEQAGKKTDILVVLTNKEKVASLTFDQTGLVRHSEQVGVAKIK